MTELGAAGGADGFVSGVVAALVFRDVRFPRMQRPVRGGERGVEQERLALPVARMIADEADGVFGDGVGVVIPGGSIVGIVGDGDEAVVADERAGIEVAARAVNGSVEAVESALQRPVVGFSEEPGAVTGGDVPFADGVGAVTGGLQGFGKGDALAVEAAPVTG